MAVITYPLVIDLDIWQKYKKKIPENYSSAGRHLTELIKNFVEANE